MLNSLTDVRRKTSGAAAAAAALFLFLIVAVPLSVAAQAPTPPVLRTLSVSGNQRQTTESIIREAALATGQPLDVRALERAVKRLYATGNFEDIKPQVTMVGTDSADLNLQVKERPFISSIQFQGLENLRESTVLDTVRLRAGAPFSPARVAEAGTMVRELLADKGIQLRSFEHRLEPVPESPGEYRLVLDVKEGGRVALADVQFEGNEIFSDKQLAGALGTKKEGFFWFRSGTYSEEDVRNDLRDRLPSFYYSHGYLDFAVTGDTIQVDATTGKARLIISVDEGEQYKLAEFDIRGNRRFATSDLMRYFEQAGGGFLGLGFGAGETTIGRDSIFNATAFAEATQRVGQLYRNQGYLMARVEPVIEKVEGEQAVRAAWEIIEGEPAYINEVNIVGNSYTHEDVIRGQLLTLPGDVYSEELLIQSYQRISALGFFETPMPLPRIEDAGNGDVNITYEVKEKQTGSINFGTAVGGGTGLAGFIGYDQPNLFGKAKSGHLRWEFGRYSNNFEASYTDPAIRDSWISGSLSVFSSRDRFYQFDEGQRRRTGSAVRIGLPFPNDNRARVTLGYMLARTTYEEFEDARSSVFSLPPGVQSTVTLGLQRQTLDHPLFPTSGTRLDLEANFNGGILGGNGDFQKYLVNGSWFVPVGRLGGNAPGSRPIRMTLGLSAEGGALFGDASRFPFERFFMGGVQFGRPLRGYDETTITPIGYVPESDDNVPLQQRFGDAYLRLSAEYAIRFNDNLSVSAFYDAGSVWREPTEFNPTRLFRGAGLGVQLVTPFGPIGLDYAYGFDKTNPGWQLHFKFGQGF